VSELRDRLERLARRGTPRGADEALQAAQRSAPHEVSLAAVPHRDDRDLEIIDDEVPFVSAEPARRRGRFGTLIAATGVAVLAGVGMLAVTAMFGSGGADSPEAAVKQLADAVSHEDPLAAVDVLSPSEVRTLHETVQDISQRAADLKIIDRASAPLAGVDLSVDGLQMTTTDLADGYAKVTITGGTISASTHREALSKLLQDATRDAEGGASDKANLARLSGSDLPTFVITVRHDGRWYVSPIYTAFEYAREANDGPPAEFGSADASKLGADTPEHAIEDALRAAEAGDWDRLMALAPPSELPVYDYRAWIGREATADRPDFTIDRMTTTADVNGDHGVVKLEAAGTFGSDGDRQTWQVGGSCPSPGNYMRFSFDSSEWRNTETGPDVCLAGDLGQAVPFGLLYAEPTPESAASGPVSVRVVRESGRWFVSPVGTVLDAIDNFVESVDDNTIYPMFGWGYLLPTDAALTLNQPVAVPEGGRLAYVFSFDGKKGQRVIGLSEGGAKDYESYLSGELYLNGRNVGWVAFQSKSADGYCCAYPETLPETGNYRLVVTGYVVGGTTLTLFDTDHAPKELLDNDGGFIEGPGVGEECTVRPNGSVHCKFAQATKPLHGEGTVSVPTTMVAGREVTATTSP
jgi:hypothetical protein